MAYRKLAIAGVSLALLGPLPAAAHPDHGSGGCMPGMPGGYCIPKSDEKAYTVGETLPDGYGELAQWERFDLPEPPDGQSYSMIDGDIVLYDQESKIVLKVAKILDTSF